MKGTQPHRTLTKSKEGGPNQSQRGGVLDCVECVLDKDKKQQKSINDGKSNLEVIPEESQKKKKAEPSAKVMNQAQDMQKQLGTELKLQV